MLGAGFLCVYLNGRYMGHGNRRAWDCKPNLCIGRSKNKRKNGKRPNGMMPISKQSVVCKHSFNNAVLITV